MALAQSSEPAVSDVAQAQAQPPAGPRNRPRASHACQRCRAKKAKCDQNQPCSNCVRYSSACVFTPGNRGGRRRDTNSTRDQSSNQGHPTRHPDPTPLPVDATTVPQNASRLSVSALSERDSIGTRSSSPPRDHASGQSGNVHPISTEPSTLLNCISRLHPANDPRQRH
jgi:hypothetical protein